MSYPEYRNDLNRIYESEILGEILFATAARLAWSQQRKRKWLWLRKLESQTKERLIEFLQQRQQQANLSRPVKTRGYCYGLLLGLLLGLLPWPVSMKILEHGTIPFLKVYKRLEENSDENSREFFSYVVAHEEAIAEFARLERAGQSGHSIKAVMNLLGQDTSDA
jgi:hypothetical protein